MIRIGPLGVLGATSLTLAGCLGGGPKEDTGTLAGAVTGALVGSAVGNGNIGAVAAGALLGGFIGNQIGADLDETDRRLALDAQYRALEYGNTGAPVEWHGRSGRYGNVLVGSRYRINTYDCRDYTQTIYIDGRPQVARGTACRQPDGTWRPVS